MMRTMLLLSVAASGRSSGSQYIELEAKLLNSPFYEPLFLNDSAPVDRYQRRKWVSELSFPFPIMLYKYAYGNNLGTLLYAWRIPPNEPVDNTITGKIFANLCRKQAFYAQGFP